MEKVKDDAMEMYNESEQEVRTEQEIENDNKVDNYDADYDLVKEELSSIHASISEYAKQTKTGSTVTNASRYITASQGDIAKAATRIAYEYSQSNNIPFEVMEPIVGVMACGGEYRDYFNERTSSDYMELLGYRMGSYMSSDSYNPNPDIPVDKDPVPEDEENDEWKAIITKHRLPGSQVTNDADKAIVSLG